MADDGLLLLENRRVHDALDAELVAFCCAVTALDLEEADACFSRFKRALFAHMRFEDDEVFPAVARLHDDPLDKLPQQLDGDHRILERSVEKARASLARLRAGGEVDLRRRMVLELDSLLLLRRVLEHHDEREARFAYPLLERGLSDDEKRSLLERMRRST